MIQSQICVISATLLACFPPSFSYSDINNAFFTLYRASFLDSTDLLMASSFSPASDEKVLQFIRTLVSLQEELKLSDDDVRDAFLNSPACRPGCVLAKIVGVYALSTAEVRVTDAGIYSSFSRVRRGSGLFSWKKLSVR